MPEDDSTLVEEGQYALEEATAQLQKALDLTVIQIKCFLQEASTSSHVDGENNAQKQATRCVALEQG